VLHGGLRGDEDGTDVHRQGAIQIFEAIAVDGRDDGDAGVVDQNVDAAKFLDRPLHGGNHRLGIGAVRLDRQSLHAERMPFTGGGVYAMSKAALVGLVKGLARDLGPRGITINNVQPGPVDTDMNPATSDFAKMLMQQMALPRYGTGDEIASLVAYLASPEAAFVTGASLSIDGGFTA